ncbi:MAG: hypothetical protein RIS86_829 [Planctomycetota bacterium]
MSEIRPGLPAFTRAATAYGSESRLAQSAREGDARGLALEAAKTLVAEAFVKPVFASLREGSLAAGPFEPGTAEKRFRPMLDALLADRFTEGANLEVVERVADRFERSIARGAQAGGVR